MSSSTIKSLPTEQMIPHPSVPSSYLTHLVVQTLLRKGFEGAEAGALSEIERLLEHHISRTFEDSCQYANLANREKPVTADVWAAHEAGWKTKTLRRESRRRRQVITLNTIPAPSASLPPITLDTLPPQLIIDLDGEDRKPQLSSTGEIIPSVQVERLEHKGEVPSYAFDWAPGLPGKWTYATLAETDEVPPEPPMKVTASSLDFVKASVSSGDVPPELGIVNYRTSMMKRKR